MTQTLTPPTTKKSAMTPPQPPLHNWLMGDLNEFRQNQLHYLQQMALTGAAVTKTRFLHVPLYFINSPEAIKHVLQTNNKNYIKEQRFVKVLEDGADTSLFTSDGEDWLWRRRLMQPQFNRQVVANFGRIIEEETAAMLGRWQAGVGTLEVEDAMMNLTMQIIGKAMFSVDILAEAPGLHHAYNFIGPHVIYRLNNFLAAPLVIPTPYNKAFWQATETIQSAIRHIIAERRDHGPKHDLLDMLLGATGEDGRVFTDSELSNEMSGIMFAGHETTATTLTWAFYLLSQNPAVAEQVTAELDAVLGGRTPTYDDLPNLPYGKQVIQETMRLYPAAHASARQSVEDDDVEGYHIPGQSSITINIYGVHHNPAYWPDPERFDPDRFSPEGLKAQTKLAYLPFLTGPRRCIGEHLAMAEAQLVLAIIAQRYRLVLAGPHPIPATKFALRTADGLLMRLEPRKG